MTGEEFYFGLIFGAAGGGLLVLAFTVYLVAAVRNQYKQEIEDLRAQLEGYGDV